jgi:hypothetical protein
MLRLAVGLDLIDLFNPDSWRGIVMASYERRDVGRSHCQYFPSGIDTANLGL